MKRIRTWKYQRLYDESHALRKWALKRGHMTLFRIADTVANYLNVRRYGPIRKSA